MEGTEYMNLTENTTVKQLGILDYYKRLVALGYESNKYLRINKNKDRYLMKLHNLFEYYKIWNGSYNDINDKEKLIALMNSINLFILAYDIHEDNLKSFEVDKINFSRFENLK